MRIAIRLPDDRDFAGTLEVLDEQGARVFGPVAAAGRAHDKLARDHGNASRNPLRLYGDTPLGTYRVRGVLEFRGAQGFDGEASAKTSVVLLEPAVGPAALADAHGRFRFFIQGGCGDRDLRATAGGIRLRDSDLKQLVALVQGSKGRIPCEIVTAEEQGTRVSLAPTPSDDDPPALPDRPYAPTRHIAGTANVPGGFHAMPRYAGYAPRLFVAAETSGAGSGGTTYGGGGGGTGGTDTQDGPNDTTGSPLPVTGTDVAPTPGVDLNVPADLSILKILDTPTPASLLFPGPTTQSGYTPIVGVQAGGWVFSLGTQTADNPYTNSSNGGVNAPYTGNAVGTYTNAPQEAAGTNQFTGTLPTEPYSGTTAPVQGTSTTDTGQATAAPVQRDTLDNQDAAIQDMVQRFQQQDQELAAAQAAQAQQQTQQNAQVPGQNTPPSPPNTAQTQPGTQGSGTAPLPPPPADDTTTPWLPAAVAAAASSQVRLPTSGPLGTPPGVIPPPPQRTESAGAWDRANASDAAWAGIQEQMRMGFLDPALTRGGMSTGTATDLGNISRRTGLPTIEGTVNRIIRGQTAEISAYDARVAGGEVGLLAPSGATINGLDYATASRLPNGDWQINIGDTASRFTTNPFKTSPGAAPATWQAELARTFGANGNLSLPDPVMEQGIRDAHAAGRVNPVQIDTVDFSAQGQGRMTVNGTPVPVDSASPTSRGGGGGGGKPGLGDAAAGGAVVGGVVSTLVNAAQILWNPDAHPDAVRELSTTALLGTASGATGATIESAFVRSMVSEGAPALESTLGRSAGGGLGGGPAAAFFTLGQMALSDKDYTAEDYEAKGTRAFVAGSVGGALSAGFVGAVWGSEVPILGNIAGFAVGFIGYTVFDAFFGDDIEDSVRTPASPIGDFEMVQDPSGFAT